ncbi:YbbC/YhhH family protein [Mucilaginibacter sabulilitoris]|uniref:YbbC/YhhH family protein n=1 Tax=Mucilaginibacter sabulilitoris TaxID=1173583 RepID=A0ABZ0THB6_9SPHI|nr:YbbC/YhhH family protein [Mucilaginibacter sabulilitoris]WPU92352.1 YbbC/YhhH family protein [Mucilaginibacter sabulilitoris]
MKIGLTLLVILMPLFSLAQQHQMLGLEVAKSELKDALVNKTDVKIKVDKVISNKQTAIAVSEPILFKVYGKDQILQERPYEVYKINGYWVLNGTLPEGMLGGGFLIILAAKDGQVLKLTHYK